MRVWYRQNNEKTLSVSPFARGMKALMKRLILKIKRISHEEKRRQLKNLNFGMLFFPGYFIIQEKIKNVGKNSYNCDLKSKLDLNVKLHAKPI